MPQIFARAVFLLTAAFFAAFFLWPVLQILQGGFLDANGHLTFAYLALVLADPLHRAALANSFLLACAATSLALLLALPLAFVSDRFLYPGKSVLGALALVPMILPPFVGAIGLRQIFGLHGALNALVVALGLRPAGWAFDWLAVHPFWGVAVVEALSLYPIIYLNAAAALAHVDPALEEAAANLGCTGFRRFFRITLPLIRPGLFAGGTIVFIWAFTELGVPLVFDYNRVASVQIFAELKNVGTSPAPYALVTVMLTGSVLLYAVGKGLFGRAAFAMMSRAAGSAGPRPLPGRRGWVCTVLFAGITLAAVLPHVGVVLVAFSRDWYGTLLPARWTLDNFRLALGHELTVPAIANSLKFAAAATVVDLGLGVAIAWVIVRSRLPDRQILDYLAMLPLAVPGLVLAFGYLAMSQEGRVFAFLNPVENPTSLLIIAYAMRRLPYVVRAAAAGFEQSSVTLEEAAQNLGCPPFKAVVKITLPLIAANLLAGALLAFAFAVMEVSDSLILAQKQAFFPITKAILELFGLVGDGKYLASALGVWAMVFLGVTIGGLSLLLGKKLGTMFRA